MAIRISMELTGNEKGQHTHYVASSLADLSANSEFVDDWGDEFQDIQDGDTLITEDGAVMVGNKRGNLFFVPLGNKKEAPGYKPEEEAAWRAKVAAEKA